MPKTLNKKENKMNYISLWAGPCYVGAYGGQLICLHPPSDDIPKWVWMVGPVVLHDDQQIYDTQGVSDTREEAEFAACDYVDKNPSSWNFHEALRREDALKEELKRLKEVLIPYFEERIRLLENRNA